ncbi:dihydroxyacetone kinase subunit DhaL [Nakamurella leprariae]|uniref:Dihydroxyacetone kinase subunit L n=1 Tax=Nakamurella leprariae TaxID=2803911 RepID=A0A939C1J7_9ACTN|nr:dihydroxyacetone kinase subunit DhaL [Nakamurella leprariae]MBM9467229.1 dihydroxyacetone kinase subunit L [Nakamurella leprariae]
MTTGTAGHETVGRGCTAESVVDALRGAADAVIADKARLTALDREIGDGDHGENLARGFTAVLAKLDSQSFATPAAVLKLVATTLISTVGGASGPLFGTAFLRASTALGDHTELTGAAVAAALAAARDGVVARGKAEPGDKTMVDALFAAVGAAQHADREGGTARQVLTAAADAAEKGAEATVPLRARKGRASYLGERSIGHPDPGAVSIALLLRTLAATADTSGRTD